MSSLNFCPQCGTKLQSGDAFCPSCGSRLVVEPPQPIANLYDAPSQRTRPLAPEAEMKIEALADRDFVTVPPTQPLPAEPIEEEGGPQPSLVRSNKTNAFPKILVVGLVVLLAGAGGWYWWKNIAPEPVTQTPTNVLENPQSVLPVTGSSGIKLADFDGVWRSYWANSSQEQEIRIGNPEDDLFIEVRGNDLKMYPRSNKVGGADLGTTCGTMDGRQITCETWEKASPGTKYRLKLELSSDKTDLKVTEIPDIATEPVIIKCKRVSAGDGAPDERLVDPTAYEVPDSPIPLSQSYFPPVTGPLSEKQAIDRVRLIPEVKDWLRLLKEKGAKAFIEVNHSEDGKYVIRCYEIVNDEGMGHTATQGWYSVDKQTGFVDFYLP